MASIRRGVAADRSGVLAGGAGVLAIALAVYQVATPGGPAATYESLLDWLREGLFTAYLLVSVLAVRSAVGRGLAPAGAGWSIGIGYAAIAVGVVYGMVTRDDPDWFFVLAGPGNLAAAGGFVGWAVWGLRRRALPLWAACMGAVGGVVAVLGAELGTSVVVAGFWFYVAARLRGGVSGPGTDESRLPYTKPQNAR